jgi:aminoglycoside phosphotransferase (APT) family kinase protein
MDTVDDNHDALGRALESAFPGVRPIRPLRALGRGFDHAVVETAGKIVFRVPLHAAAEAAQRREVQLMHWLQPQLKSVAVPRPLFHREPTPELPFGAAGYARLVGRQLLPDDVRGGAALELAQQLAKFMKELHSLPLAADSPFDLPALPPPMAALDGLWQTVDSWLRERLDSWEYHRMLDWWRQARAAWRRQAYQPVLLHGDLWYENILVDSAGRRILGVVDFGSAAVGDPAADLAPQQYLGSSFLRRVAMEYTGGEEEVALRERVPHLLGLRELMGLAAGVERGDVDVDSLAKVRETVLFRA